MAVNDPKKQYAEMISRNMGNLDRSANQQPFQFKAAEPFSYNPQTDPGYQSALQQARQNLAIDQGNTNAFLSGRGQGKSSYSEQIANQLSNQSNERIATSVLPQYMQQAYQRYADDANRSLQTQQLNYGAQQDQFRNLSSLVDMASYQDQRGLDNDMAMRDYALREANLTGTLRNPELSALYQSVIDQKNKWDAGSPEERAAAAEEANRLRQQIAMMGGNSDIVAKTVTLDDAVRNIGQQGGIQTEASRQADWQREYAQQQMDYQTSRDAILDERYKQQFDEDVRRYGLDYAMRKAESNSMIQSRNDSAANAAHNRIMDIWRATGVAPEGVNGVQAGTPYYDPATARQNTVNIQDEVRGLSDVLRTGQMTPGQALAQIDQDQRLGFYTQEEADQLKASIEVLIPSFVETLQGEEQQEIQDNYLSSLPTNKEIEAEARELGYPVLDYRSYYKSPNGKMAGLSYEQWSKVYGPSLRQG